MSGSNFLQILLSAQKALEGFCESSENRTVSASCEIEYSCAGEGEEGMGSFIDHDLEGDMGGDASDPGSAVKKRKGLGSRALYASAGARPQPPIQPGATLTGEQIQSTGA